MAQRVQLVLAYTAYGPSQQLLTLCVPEVKNVQDQHPTALRVKVHAASLNPIDFKRRNGLRKAFSPGKWLRARQPRDPDACPVILGLDASGVVDQVGPQVTKLKVGDAVYLRLGRELPHQGTCTKYTLTTEAYVARRPKNVSFEEAAAFPLAALTALQMLRKGGIKPGDRVLVNAAAGGVGHFAVQLAKALGASFVVGTASAPKHALLKQLGCDETVDYKTQDIIQVYKDRPFDIALDFVGECIPLCKVVKQGGWIVSAVQGWSTKSFAAAGIKVTWAMGMYMYYMRWSLEGAVKVAKVNFSHLLLRGNAADLEELTTFIETGKLSH